MHPGLTLNLSFITFGITKLSATVITAADNLAKPNVMKPLPMALRRLSLAMKLPNGLLAVSSFMKHLQLKYRKAAVLEIKIIDNHLRKGIVQIYFHGAKHSTVARTNIRTADQKPRTVEKHRSRNFAIMTSSILADRSPFAAQRQK